MTDLAPISHARCRAILAVAVALLAASAAGSERTVCDSERGMIFGDPADGSFAGIGANVDVIVAPDFASQTADSIKVSHGRFHVFNADDDTTWTYFPTSALRAYEATEVAAGRAPIFVTATYAGKQRPVLWSWSLGFVGAGQAPTTPSSYWKQAVNLGDDRFIRFWIHAYAYPKLLAGIWNAPNAWVGCDECAFMYGLYGVLDDDGHWVPGVPWDPPFAQTSDDYIASVKTFFRRAGELAPGLRIMTNDGGVEVDAQTNTVAAFEDIYAVCASGLMQEDCDYYDAYPDAWGRGQHDQLIQRYQWLGTTGKPLIAGFGLASTDAALADDLTTAYATYLLFRGDDSFFAPQYTDLAARTEVSPTLYAAMRDRLGLPVAPMQSASATDDGFRLYWRPCQGGLVYLNWTGATTTVTLPAGAWWRPDATPTTTLTIADRRGAWVTSRPGPTADRPLIAPRIAGTASGPVDVRLSCGTAGAVIRYTLDGSEPTAASPAYVGPIHLTASAAVTAATFPSGMNASWSNRATYAITSTPPAAAFHAASDEISEAAGHWFATVQLDHAAGAPVQVDYAVVGGTATAGADYALAPGTLAFQPGQTTQVIPLAIVDDAIAEPIETVVIALTGARGATIGAVARTTCSIVDDDGGPVDLPPSAAIAATPESGVAPLTVAFDGRGSSDPDGAVVAWAWAFGDGAVATGATAQHVYATAGAYTATLTVADDGGASASATAQVTVAAPPGDTTPPLISGVSALRVTASSATIAWTTDEPADSQVQYGRTTAYGSSSPLDRALTTSHIVTLTGLSRKTTYHYRVLGRDAAGNLGTSDDAHIARDGAVVDYTFTTADDAAPATTDTSHHGCGGGAGLAALALTIALRRRRAVGDG